MSSVSPGTPVSWTLIFYMCAFQVLALGATIGHACWQLRWRDRYPPSLIEEVRRLSKEGAFRRRILRRTPRSRFRDDLELVCGHKTVGWPDSPEALVDCDHCEKQWLRQQRGACWKERLLTRLRLRKYNTEDDANDK